MLKAKILCAVAYRIVTSLSEHEATNVLWTLLCALHYHENFGTKAFNKTMTNLKMCILQCDHLFHRRSYFGTQENETSADHLGILDNLEHGYLFV